MNLDEHDEEIWQEAFAEGWARGQSTMRAEVERLTADFLEYGSHKPDCRGGDGDNLCTCGYLMARATLEPKS
jgi:hypothetical protein